MRMQFSNNGKSIREYHNGNRNGFLYSVFNSAIAVVIEHALLKARAVVVINADYARLKLRWGAHGGVNGKISAL